MNDDYRMALNTRLFYVIETDDMECFPIIQMNDQSKSWNGMESLMYWTLFEHPVYEGPSAKNLRDQVDVFHWYERSSNKNYLIPFANVRRYVNKDKTKEKIKYGLVIEKLTDDDGNWQTQFYDYLITTQKFQFSYCWN